MMKPQRMFGPTLWRGHVSTLGEGGALNIFLTNQAESPLHLAFEEMTVEGGWIK